MRRTQDLFCESSLLRQDGSRFLLVKVAYSVTRQDGTFVNVKGLPSLRDRFAHYSIKVSFWGSGTLKIVITDLRRKSPP